MRVVEISEEVKIEDLSHDARGIARVEGKIVFIEGALPGEVVRFRYLKKKKDYDEAVLQELIQASPYRVTPKCAHFAICGGCSLQHLSAEGQLIFKQNHWLALMKKMGGGLPDHVLPPLQSDVWNYRRKDRLGVKYVAKKEKTLIGFREKKHGQYIIDMHECHILDSGFQAHFNALQTMLHQMPSKAFIPQVELAVGDIVALVFRHLQALTLEDEMLLSAFAKQSGFRIYLQAKGPDSLKLFAPVDALMDMQLELPVAGLKLSFQPLDFFQVNASMNDLMIKQALHLLDLKPGDRVLDLFCGLGNFTLAMAPTVEFVYGVEGNALMIERARVNANAQGVENISFHVADLQTLEAVEQFKEMKFNKVLLDPARDGAEAAVIALAKLGIKHILYVSCHPATLARDAEILRTQYGYKMAYGGVMDMFPHTNHIESMAVFIKE